MYCPNLSCQESADRPRLLITDRAGIEIDYCPNCRGVWLDRGELDKLIERSQSDVTSSPQPVPAATHTEHRQNQDHRDYQKDNYYKDSRNRDPHYKDGNYGHYGKRKKSLLSEIFDF
jgi:hypothetical protein